MLCSERTIRSRSSRPIGREGNDVSAIAYIAALAAGGAFVRKSTKTPWDAIFTEKARKYGVDANLLKAIAATESSFRPDAVGDEAHPAGPSVGLMQILRTTAESLGETNLERLKIPEVSIELAAKLLHELQSRWDTISKVIAAYNAGSPKRRADGAFINQEYVMKVQERYVWYTVSELFSWMDPILEGRRA